MSAKNRFYYKVNHKTQRSCTKETKAIKAYQKLQGRVKTEGETALIKNALVKAEAKLTKFGIDPKGLTQKAAK